MYVRDISFRVRQKQTLLKMSHWVLERCYTARIYIVEYIFQTKSLWVRTASEIFDINRQELKTNWNKLGVIFNWEL